MLKITLEFLILSGICGSLVMGYFPPSLNRCAVDDEQCFKIQAQRYVDHYKFGIPEYGVPGVEPLELDKMRYQVGNEKSSLQMNVLVTNTSITNFGNGLTVSGLKINASTTDLSKPIKVVFKLSFPKFDVSGDYTLKGKFIILPMNSKGKLTAKMTKVVVTAGCLAQPEKRADGNLYLRVIRISIEASIDSTKVHFTNLFKDPELTESVVKVFNDESASFIDEMKPTFVDGIKRKANSLLQKLFDVIPYNGMFLNKKEQ